MLHKKICLQQLFKSAFCTALISELAMLLSGTQSTFKNCAGK